MEEKLQNHNFGSKDAIFKILKKTTENVIRPNKCNQCDYASFQTGNLKKHLKTHSGEKSNKCNQCDFASYEKGNLRTHLKKTLEKSHINATSVTMHALTQVL